jgi:predicted RNase H-like HicB family nuclease
MRQFVVVVEQAEGNFSAYSPDLPGCVATGNTVDETMRNMGEAIRFHLGLRRMRHENEIR